MLLWLIVPAFAADPAPTAIHHSEVDVVFAVPPFVTAAPVRCVVRVVIDGKGDPTEVSAKDCAEPDGSEAVKTAWRGRWQLRTGQVAPLQFDLPVRGLPLIPDAELAVTFPTADGEVPATVGSRADVECAVRLVLDERGLVTGVDYRGPCPMPLQMFVDAHFEFWSALPWTVAGTPTPALADITFGIADGSFVSSNRIDTRVKRTVMPVYPEEAKGKYAPRVPVLCRARVVVSEEGRVESVDFLSGPELFEPETRGALMKWVFTPPMLHEQPRRASFVLKVQYVLK